MESVLISIAIVVAVFLVFGTVVKPHKPRFRMGSRLSRNALLYRISELGKTCRAVGHGSGLSGSELYSLRRIVKSALKKPLCGLDKNLCVSDNAYTLLRGIDMSRNAARLSHTLPHCGIYPRVFLLCRELICSTQCAISKDVFCEAVEDFQKHAELTFRELDILTSVAAYCLCLALAFDITDEQAREREYSAGVSDGKKGKINLDALSSSDYICGLLSAVSEAERPSFEAVMIGNNVNIDEADLVRRARLSGVAATLSSVVQSLQMLGEINYSAVEFSSVSKIFSVIPSYAVLGNDKKAELLEKVARISEKSRDSELAVAHRFADTAMTIDSDLAEIINGKPLSTAAIVFRIATPLMLVIAATVLVGIFVPVRYVAVFPVSALVIYALFRPITGLPKSLRKIIFFKPEFLRKKRLDKTRKSGDVIRFGGEPDYKRNILHGKDAELVSDNRGVLEFSSGGEAYVLDIFASSDDGRLTLPMCDGTFERHGTVYRAADRSMEFAAEFIAPLEYKSAVCRVTLINRECLPRRAEISVSVIPKSYAVVGTVPVRFDGGSGVMTNDGKIGLGVADRLIDDVVSETAGTGLLSFIVACDLSGFERRTGIISVISGERQALGMMFSVACENGFFEREKDASRVFGALDRSKGFAASSDDFETFIPMPDAEAYNLRAPYEHEMLPNAEYSAELSFGGFTENGAYSAEPSGDIDHDFGIVNAVCNGKIYCEMSCAGAIAVYAQSDAGGGRKTVTSNVYAVLGEDGILWSPTKHPLGDGELRVKHCVGYSEYKSLFNGTACVMRVYAVENKPAVIFDITITGTVDFTRNIDVMLSAIAADGCSTVISDGRNGEYVAAVDGECNGIALFSSESSECFTGYKEGYFTRGKIRRVRDFAVGGTTAAPTITVAKSLSGSSETRIVFCVTTVCGTPHIDGITEEEADASFERAEKMSGKLFVVRPVMGDLLLNGLFLHSQYTAYIGGFMRDRIFGGLPAARDILYCAVACVHDCESVREYISNICAAQRTDGKTECVGNDRFAQLCLPFIAKIYVDRVGDESLFYEVMPFADGNARLSVLEHCLRAVEYSINSIGSDFCFDIAVCAAMRMFMPYCSHSRKILFVEAFADTKSKCDGCFDGKRYVCDEFDCETKIESQILPAIFGICNADESRRALDRVGAAVSDAGSVFEMLLYSYARYCTDEFDKAYSSLRSAGEKLADRLLYCGSYSCGNNSNMYENGAENDVALLSAMYYIVVSKGLLGINFCGNKVRVNPSIAQNVPDVRFDLRSDRGIVRVDVDGSGGDGGWLMKIDKVTYGTENIALDGEYHSRVFFYKNKG